MGELDHEDLAILILMEDEEFNIDLLKDMSK